MAIGNAKYIYEFARDVNNAPIRELAEAEMKTGNLHYISVFARNVKGASVFSALFQDEEEIKRK